MKRLLMMTAFVAAVALPTGIGQAVAQSSSDSTAPSPAQPANPAPAQVEAAPVTPPPSDAIIAKQASGDMRADKLIGMKVYNPNGDEVGKVKDVLFAPDGSVKGVVLSIGGVLGIGAKPVGLQWKEIEVQPQNEAATVKFTKEQLEAAPTFQTQEASAAMDTNSNQPAQPLNPQPASPAAPSPNGSAPAPAPAPSQ
ncbi:MAG TPA: PRC-barrel domain-containing protein [Dongiaceae bacterium]